MRRKKGKILKIFMVIALIGIVIPLGGLYWWVNQPVHVDNPITNDNNSNEFTEEELRNRISILLIGADQRGDDEAFNTDSIILATIDPKGPRISLLSIPRDTKVSIPGHPNIKINSIAPLTDLETLQEKVSDLTGLPITGYILTNFNGFKDIIDTLGGITIDVEKNMYFETGDKEDGFINLKKGLQKLDGSKALQYARFRNDALADISRTARQQVVLKALADEMLQLSTIPKLPWIIPQLNEAVETNLSTGVLLKLGKTGMQFRNAEIVTQTLPGRFLDLNGISYWDVDPDETKNVVRNLLKGITTSKVIGESEVDLLDPPIVDEETQAPPKVPGNDRDPNGNESNEVPEYPEIPRVPGSPTDPNGDNSDGYEEFEGDNTEAIEDRDDKRNEDKDRPEDGIGRGEDNKAKDNAESEKIAENKEELAKQRKSTSEEVKVSPDNLD